MLNPSNKSSTNNTSSSNNYKIEDNSSNTNDSILNKTPDFYISFLNKEQKEKEKEDISNLSSIEGEVPYIKENYHFFCEKCYTVPSIQFHSFAKINYSCNCKECDENQFQYLKDIKYEEISDEDINHYLFCNEHKSEYCYYCYTCSTNLCRDCLRLNNNHVGHNFFLFDENIFETNQKINDIQKILFEKQKSENNDFLNLLHSFFQSEEFNDTIINKYVKPFFNVICNDFKLYPNYSHFEIINNFNFLIF